MKSLYIRYDKDRFWKNYWDEFGVDHEEFIDLNIYPIDMTLKHVRRNDRILECGFGGGRVIRHLTKHGYDVEGIEYDYRIVEKLKKVDIALKISRGNILKLDFADNYFDTTLCFGVINGLCDNMAKAVFELKRVTRKNGIVLLSVLLNNVARKAQKIFTLFAKEKKDFYSWVDDEKGWENYFKTFDLHIIDSQPSVSRYNIFYWGKVLRSSQKTDLKLARIKEDEFKLNALGELVWLLHKKIFKEQFAGSMVFALRNHK